MSVLLYVYLKNYDFSIPLLLPLYQGSTLSLPNVVTYPHCFKLYAKGCDVCAS